MNSVKTVHDSNCREFRAQLEDVASALPGAKSVTELLAGATPALRGHAAACAHCRSAAENILASRALLAVLPAASEPGPWFAPRVMAAIAARTAELSRAADAWTFLPKLAARLTWASSIALLLASGWLFQRPHANPPKAVITDIAGDPVVESAPPAADDELLLSRVEREPAPR